MLEPDAKAKLAATVRDLRARLLKDLHDQADGRYRLGVPVERAGLSEEERTKRLRLEAWIDEQADSDRRKKESQENARARHRLAAEKLAAATLLNRLVVVKVLEARERILPHVVTGGWTSAGYRDFREFAAELAHDDPTEGYATLLELVFEELALDLPGLFGKVEIAELFPPSPVMLRRLVEALDQPELRSAWTDDTTLGWIYQYWNDPEREALDAKLNAGGKVEPHEIASKTQMFTERYMVEWLLHNSLGQIWLAMCRKHGWTPAVVKHGTLDALEERRAEWRRRREAGSVALDALMPIRGGLEERWKYWVPQPLPEDAVDAAPERLEDLKVLDPACGSGHFLVIAFDLLHELYQEEARHRGERVDHTAIAEKILENNLHGIDIDPRAVQIAAAALLLTAWQNAPDARPRRLNLVASNLKLGSLAQDDPALVELRRAVRVETRLPEELADRIVGALAGADHLGSLLQVGKEVRGAIEEFLEKRREEVERSRQGTLFGDGVAVEEIEVDVETLMESLIARLETFLADHTGGDDLGLRLHGEQLASGMRFVQLLQEGTYDLVIGNPPYLGSNKLSLSDYIETCYSKGKANLFAMFWVRCLELARNSGVIAMITLRDWMFTRDFFRLRSWLVSEFRITAIGDLGWGAFSEMRDNAVTMAVISRLGPHDASEAVATESAFRRLRSLENLRQVQADVLHQRARFTFSMTNAARIDQCPIIYWWSSDEYSLYFSQPALGKFSPARKGIDTGDNHWLVRLWWEVSRRTIELYGRPYGLRYWKPYIMGSRKGRQSLRWIEPLNKIVYWHAAGVLIQLRATRSSGTTIRNPDRFFQKGVAFSPVGTRFSARIHRFAGICDNMGTSVFGKDLSEAVCLLNSELASSVLTSLNPGVHFQVGDVNRLPRFPIADANEILGTLGTVFDEHEAHRETSVEFKHPGPSCWRYAQDWAQCAVDRDEGAPLPPWAPEYDDEPAVDHVSYAFGVALGRFGANGEGILDEAPADSLDHGILFLNALHPDDDLAHPACAVLHDAWAKHGPLVDSKRDLGTWLRERFFQDDHRKRYEERPIYLPLSSKNRTFVAWLSIHRCGPRTLPALLAERLRPALTVLEGELDDLREDLRKADLKSALVPPGPPGGAARADRRHDDLVAGRAELLDFIAAVRQISEQGPPPADPADPPREADAPFLLHLDDGVMISSAALWPLLEPQGWKKPRQWWSELCRAEGKKDYDWAHLARRYFPARVEAKCADDPSLAVAHGCFWRLHPAKAYEWELRLQDEIGEDFTLDEHDSGVLRAAFLAENPEPAAAIRAAEAKRRERKRKKQERDAAEEAERERGPGVHGPLLRS